MTRAEHIWAGDPEWADIRDKYEWLTEAEPTPVVAQIRRAVEAWQRAEQRLLVAEQNERGSLTELALRNVWRYRVLRMLGSRVGRTEIQDRIANDGNWW